MISTAHRFHGHNSLRYVYSNGKTSRGPLFAVKSAINKQHSTYRLAVVVSRKVNKSAVARNRMRRRLYAAVKAIEADIALPYDIVITVFQPSLIEETTEKLQKQILSQFKQAGILK